MEDEEAAVVFPTKRENSDTAMVELPGLTLAIVAARGLRSSDWSPGNGTSECYCILKALGRKPRELHRTKVVKDTLQPVWKEEVVVGAAVHDSLFEFSIWDDGHVGGSELLGKTILDRSSIGHGGFCGDLLLTDGCNGSDGHLTVKVKTSNGQGYPATLPHEFTASITKTDGKSWGLDLDYQDQTTLWVNSVKPGAVEAHNLVVPAEEQLRPGDFIVRANGAGGSAEELLAQFKNETTVAMLVRRPVEIYAVVEGNGGSLGLEYPEEPSGSCLVIKKVGEGPIKAWNEAHPEPDMQLKVGDRIVAVAGQRGRAKELHDLLATWDQVQIVAVRAAELGSHWRFW